MAFGFYLDSSLTLPISGNVQINAGVSDYQFWIGNPTSGVKLQDATSPGINSMEISIGDATPAEGPEVTWIKLALTQAGLDSAVAGDPLDIGATIFGGTANALSFWCRITNSLSGTLSSTDLFLSLSNVKEFVV